MRAMGTPKIAWWRKGEAGPDVLFVMGFGMRGQVWAPQIDDLRADHRCYYFDNRGLGESDPPPRRTWRMEDMADDAMRVLDEAGLDAAHVVGVSMGGMIAQHIALRAPHRVRSLSLIATHPGGFENRPTGEGLRLVLKANSAAGEARVKLLKQLLYPKEFLDTADIEEMAESMSLRFGQPAALSSRLGQLSAIMRHDTRARLGEIRVPTLVVRPAQDILVSPSGSDALAAGIPGATLMHLPKGGHGAILQCASEINAALRKHIAASEQQAVAAAAE